jgi:large subunit ribosomal protein L9
MRVVLREDVTGLGKRGDLITVADGYGRNFLLPKGKAIVASDGIVSQANSMRRARDVRDQKAKEAAEQLASKLVSTTITIRAKAGKEGKLFGSVTSHDLIDEVKRALDVDLDRKAIHLSEPIKSTGNHQVPVRLHSEVEIRLNVEVTADEQ